MTASTELSFQQRSLFQQGYQTYSAAELKQLEWGLRFTPTACSALTLVGLLWQLPLLLFAVAILGIWAFFAPGAHPMDMLYNHGVRRLVGAVPLPPNPFQRRLACLAAGVMNATAAALLLGGLTTAAWIVGGMLLALQAIVITTHFCALSYLYEGLMRLVGRWHQPLSDDEAQRLYREGALLIDVRGPEEFAADTIDGAINIPVDGIEHSAGELREKGPLLLYCRSGMRSQIAAEKLRQAGLEQAHDLGAVARLKKLLATGDDATATG
jgi:rhodanese-related sulfurtransferase